QLHSTRDLQTMSPFIFAKLILPYRERREQTMSLFVFAKLILPDLGVSNAIERKQAGRRSSLF
ncbi:hypothetical protein, partial [uncultured Bacteroides sp.]|uniref:hypothetical protein n=1 Tax=uncultured Bacteroides sp. TaxID=162156 RepID=UPI0025FD5700